MGKVPICPDCGSPTVVFTDRFGRRLYICSQYGFNYTKGRTGQILSYELSCGRMLDGPRNTFEKLSKGETDIELIAHAIKSIIPLGDLYAHCNILMMSGAPPKKLPALLDSALSLGFAVGMKPAKAIETISWSIRNARPQRLDNLIGAAAYKVRAYANEHYPELDAETGWRVAACDVVIEAAEALK